jgi:hypothetical protein
MSRKKGPRAAIGAGGHAGSCVTSRMALIYGSVEARHESAGRVGIFCISMVWKGGNDSEKTLHFSYLV